MITLLLALRGVSRIKIVFKENGLSQCRNVKIYRLFLAVNLSPKLLEAVEIFHLRNRTREESDILEREKQNMIRFWGK